MLNNEEACYLNHAAQARISQRVLDVGHEVLRKQPWELHADEDAAEIRRLYSGLIHASPNEIAIMPSTAFAITLAAQNIAKQRERGGRIVVLQDQMNSAVYGWQGICDKHRSFTLHVVPRPAQDGSWTQSVLAHIDETVVVACVPPLHWSDGSLIDLERIADKCRNFHVDLVIDATQAVGIMPLDVTRLNPCMLASSVHKWLRAPPGQSLVYIPTRLHATWEPLDQHGRSRDHGSSTVPWNAIPDEMGPRGYPEVFLPGACKFDSGGKPNPLLLPMLRASLEEVATLDVGAAQQKLRKLIEPLIAWAEERGWGVPNLCAGHLIGLRPTNMTVKEMVDIGSKLRDVGVYIAVRCGVFRVSPYVENTTEDIERLLRGLGEFATKQGESRSKQNY